MSATPFFGRRDQTFPPPDETSPLYGEASLTFDHGFQPRERVS